MLDRLEFVAKSLGNVSQMISAIVGIMALVGIYLQIQNSQILAREGSAREIYRGYLQLAVQQPRLAAPDAEAIKAGFDDHEETRYGWFVSYLLYNCEQILTNFPGDDEWLKTCSEQISLHTRYVCDVVMRETMDHFDPRMRALIKTIPSMSSSPECKKA